MKILLLGDKELKASIQSNLESFGHETIMIEKFYNDTFMENFNEYNDTEYDNVMTKLFLEISSKTEEADAILLLNDNFSISGSEYAAMVKSQMLSKDIYLYNNISANLFDRVSSFHPTFINGNVGEIGNFNKIQNTIIKKLEFGKMNISSLTENLSLDMDNCVRELERLVSRGVVSRGGNSYTLANKAYEKTKQKQFKKNQKY